MSFKKKKTRIIELKTRAIELIASSKLIEAVNITKRMAKMTSMTSEDDFRCVILISRELHSLEKAVMVGRVTYEMETAEKNKLANRMLTTLDNLCEGIDFENK